MALGLIDELGVREVGEHHVPAEREVGRVDLEVEAGLDDRLVLVAHGIGEVGQVGLVAGVMVGRLEERDDAGGWPRS